MVRPFAAVVHRCLNGQARQAMPNTALRVLVIVLVIPAGQVRVPAAGSWVKSSLPNPPARGCQMVCVRGESGRKDS